MQHTLVWAAVIVLLSLLTMFGMARTQPWQTVIAAFVWMVLLSGVPLSMASVLVGIRAEFPLWALPVLWTNTVLNSRGVAKLLLRPWRSTKLYGFWLIAGGSVLAALIFLPLKADWIWFAFAALLQFASVPWLIEKKPVVPPPNFFPLWIWVALAVGSIIYARSFATQ